MISPEYRQFTRMAQLHRRLIGQVDQKVGAEKQTIRKYIAAIDDKLTKHPRADQYFRRWRRDQGMSERSDGDSA
jgi:hypothetical protein